MTGRPPASRKCCTFAGKHIAIIAERRRPVDRPAIDPFGPLQLSPAAYCRARSEPRCPRDRRAILLDDDYLKRSSIITSAPPKLAHRLGFQFVDVKQCHRYLLSELLAAKGRPGPYGGSLENRTRLARDIITAIRTERAGLMIGRG